MARWRNENRYDRIIKAAASRYGVPDSLIKAVIAAESGFEPGAVREEDFTGRTPPSDWPPDVVKDASRGLMQVLCWRARWLGFMGDCDRLFEPYTNIMLGTQLLAWNYAKLGTWEGAISAYNGGLRPHLGYGEPLASGKYRNQDYVDRVGRYWLYFETGQMPAGADDGRAGLLAVLGVLAVAFFSLAAARLQAVAVEPTSLWQIVNTVGVIVIAFGAGDAWRRMRHLERKVDKLYDRLILKNKGGI